MRFTVLAAVVGLACWAVPSAQAQFQVRPQTNTFTPAGRGFSPLFGSGFGGGGLFGPSNFGFGGAPFGGAAFGPGVGNPYAIPGMGGFGSVNNVAGFGTVGTNAGTTALGTRSLLDNSGGWNTGHPIRFQSYRNYFQNPNASLTGSNALTASPGPVFGTGQNRTSTAPGKRPVRGKGNVDQ